MLLREIFPLKAKTYTPARDERWSDFFGIELELEGVRNAKNIPLWGIHEDGSLRDGMEYVLSEPLGGANLTTALDNFYNANLKYKDSERASTHIHINMTDASVDTLRTMVAIMYVIEGPLYSVVGEARKWAGYSMSLAEMEPSRMTHILQATQPVYIVSGINTGRNTDRYYGFNVASIRKHGTVEFRYYPGGPSREELESWLDLAQAVKRAGMKHTIAELSDMINNEHDLLGYLRDILPADWYRKLMAVAVPEDLLAAFNTVAALATPNEEATKRREPLIFLSGPLLKYAARRSKTEEGRKYLEDVAKKLQVVTSGEWRYHVQKAEQVAAEKKVQGFAQAEPQPAPPNAYFDPFGDVAVQRADRDYLRIRERTMNMQARVGIRIDNDEDI